MNEEHRTPPACEDPRKVLGVAFDTTEKDISAAYLRKVKEYPPDRAPAEFERIRDAYEILRDPHRRTLHMLLSADPEAPLASLLEGRSGERRFVGPAPWLAAIKEK
jgi:curved DNA-binding protein CbpA